MKITDCEKIEIVAQYKNFYKVKNIATRFEITTARVRQVLSEEMGREYPKFKKFRSLKLKLKI